MKSPEVRQGNGSLGQVPSLSFPKHPIAFGLPTQVGLEDQSSQLRRLPFETLVAPDFRDLSQAGAGRTRSTPPPTGRRKVLPRDKLTSETTG